MAMVPSKTATATYSNCGWQSMVMLDQPLIVHFDRACCSHHSEHWVSKKDRKCFTGKTCKKPIWILHWRTNIKQSDDVLTVLPWIKPFWKSLQHGFIRTNFRNTFWEPVAHRGKMNIGDGFADMVAIQYVPDIWYWFTNQKWGTPRSGRCSSSKIQTF